MKAVLTMFALIFFLAFLSRANAGECVGALTDLNNETNIKVMFDVVSKTPVIGRRVAGKKSDAHEKLLFDRMKKVCVSEGATMFYSVMSGTFAKPAGACGMQAKIDGTTAVFCNPVDDILKVAAGAGMKK